jgi:predicted AlkP superfamily phosphohydrolase/phosphomutase
VIGLDCAAPEILLADERLANLRRLMQGGCYGQLESVIPPITVPAWMCMATSQDPGSLGVYGFRNRADHSYRALEMVTSRSIRHLSIWDQIAIQGGRSVLVGVPPSFPPRRINGTCIGCFMTPDPTKDVYTYPATAQDEIRELVGEYPVDVKGFRTDNKDWLRDEIYRMTEKHFTVIRHFLQRDDWDYFQFVEIGVDRVHHGFWKHHDPRHKLHESGNPYESVIEDYYLYVDQELGRVLELLDDDVVVLVASDHGARPLDGGFCVNEWLVQQGLLVLRHYPTSVRSLDELDVDWDRTRVWSEGGYYARVFINLKGREPQGIVEPSEYEALRSELKQMFESTVDENGDRLGTLAFRPEDIYRSVTGIAPDLLVHFGALAWRAVGGVGYGGLHVRENDTGPDDCNHAQMGAFILAAPNNPLQGEIAGTHLLDIAPTLLELGGYDTPTSMQGRSLADGMSEVSDSDRPLSPDGEDAVRRRLSGLGYIS